MNLKEFKFEMTNKLSKIGYVLNDEQSNQFYRYMNLLVDWNNRINLTAITEPMDVIQKHFVDSLTISKYLEDNLRVADVGTGAGFPGIPVKILNPTLNVTLMDSLNKRIKFLEEVISEISLKDITAVHGRAEELGRNKKYREAYDVVTSRAVANLNILLEYMLPFVKVGGFCICMKGSNIEGEIESSEKALKILGGKIVEINEFELPDSDIKRNIILIEKLKPTPARYPRKPGTPSKEPIS